MTRSRRHSTGEDDEGWGRIPSFSACLAGNRDREYPVLSLGARDPTLEELGVRLPGDCPQEAGFRSVRRPAVCLGELDVKPRPRMVLQTLGFPGIAGADGVGMPPSADIESSTVATPQAAQRCCTVNSMFGEIVTVLVFSVNDCSHWRPNSDLRYANRAAGGRPVQSACWAFS